MDDELEIKAYYAGHVIGAAMFQCRVGDQSFVYTGMFFFSYIEFETKLAWPVTPEASNLFMYIFVMTCNVAWISGKMLTYISL